MFWFIIIHLKQNSNLQMGIFFIFFLSIQMGKNILLNGLDQDPNSTDVKVTIFQPQGPTIS
jgi:hypothetical protein